MVIFAHPDDAEIWSGGSLSKWNKQGGISKIVCFSADLARSKEAIEGAKVLGSEVETLPFEPVISKETVKTIEDQLLSFKPTILITHYFYDSHPEHRNVFDIVSNAVVKSRINSGLPKYLLCSDSYNEIGLNGVFEPNLYIDISDHFETKIESISVYKSQPYEMWKKIATDQNTLLGSRISGTKYVEGFIQVPILGKLSILTLF